MKPHFILISDLRMACPIWRILCQLRKSHLKVFQHRNVENLLSETQILLDQDNLFWVSWMEAVKEDTSKWRDLWIQIMPKITMVMIGWLTNTTSVNITSLVQATWGHTWKYTLDKSQANATSVILHPLKQAIWGHIWEHIAEKSQTNATSVTLHPLRQAIWGDIWKHTVEKSRINVNSVAFHPLRQAIWRDIWKHSAEKSNKCNKCDFALAPADNLRIHDIMNSEIAWEALHYITLVTSNFSA